jgi:hypothetical protein
LKLTSSRQLFGVDDLGRKLQPGGFLNASPHNRKGSPIQKVKRKKEIESNVQRRTHTTTCSNENRTDVYYWLKGNVLIVSRDTPHRSLEGKKRGNTKIIFPYFSFLTSAQNESSRQKKIGQKREASLFGRYTEPFFY